MKLSELFAPLRAWWRNRFPKPVPQPEPDPDPVLPNDSYDDPTTVVTQADMTIATWEEPIACVFPASGVVRTSNEELACVTSSSHAICEAEVTSCAATP